MDTPSDALGERILNALSDLWIGSRTSVHTDRDHPADAHGDRSVETDTTTVQSGDEEIPTRLRNTKGA
jgi:hypothetical protein